jgi:hypothetical protein
VNTGGKPGTAVTSTSRQMLTVSSRMKTDTVRVTRIGILALDDASPVACAQKQRPGTPDTTSH